MLLVRHARVGADLHAHLVNARVLEQREVRVENPEREKHKGRKLRKKREKRGEKKEKKEGKQTKVSENKVGSGTYHEEKRKEGGRDNVMKHVPTRTLSCPTHTLSITIRT